MWRADRIPRCCGRSIHTWCLFTSHLCYPSWACCRWIHAWHPAMPMFFFADSVREVLITHSLLQGCHSLPDWQNCERKMLWHKGNFNLWDFADRKKKKNSMWHLLGNIFIFSAGYSVGFFCLIFKAAGAVIDGLILAAAAGQVFMHAWDESLRLRGLEGRMRVGV